jgi:hypothetical protein
LIGLIFLWSAVSKLTGRTAAKEFFGVTRRLLSACVGGGWATRTTARIVGVVVISVELATPAALAIPALVRIGFGVALVMLLSFSYAIVAAMHRGISTACACFGRSTAPLGAPHLVRNTLLSVAVITGLVVGPEHLGGVPALALAVPALAALASALVLVRLDDLVDLFAPSTESRSAYTPKR